jgi:hypothetical protein
MVDLNRELLQSIMDYYQRRCQPYASAGGLAHWTVARVPHR